MFDDIIVEKEKFYEGDESPIEFEWYDGSEKEACGDDCGCDKIPNDYYENVEKVKKSLEEYIKKHRLVDDNIKEAKK